jgi:hypothetical protein
MEVMCVDNRDKGVLYIAALLSIRANIEIAEKMTANEAWIKRLHKCESELIELLKEVGFYGGE